ncbi:MAG: BrnT family toxin [Chloroflexi bacterium]|nr:BrnT family toxin [Chloroflexota bacterium]
MLRIEALEIDDHILEKIEKKHRVTIDEVEDACYAASPHVRRARGGLIQLHGRTGGGRYLAVLLADHGAGVWKVVSAREMTLSERRLYARETKK